MAAPEPNELDVSTGEHPIRLEGYDDFYSSYWRADTSLETVMSVIDNAGVAETADAILYTEETPHNRRYPLEKAIERSQIETPRFFRVDSNRFAITWEQRGDHAIIGYISEYPDEETMLRLYYRTTKTDLSESEQNLVNEFLEGY